MPIELSYVNPALNSHRDRVSPETIVPDLRQGFVWKRDTKFLGSGPPSGETNPAAAASAERPGFQGGAGTRESNRLGL